MLTMLRNILCDGYGDRQHCHLSFFTFCLILNQKQIQMVTVMVTVTGVVMVLVVM